MKTKLSASHRPSAAANGHATPSPKPRKMLISGRWVGAASGETFHTFDPATGEVICPVAAGDKADVDAAVQAARAAFESGPWRTMTASERGKLI